MAKILTRNQFEKLKPNGDYNAYLKFVANRRGVSVSTLRSESPRYTAKEFARVAAKQAARGSGAPGVNPDRKPRTSQSVQQVKRRGYVKWFDKKYRPGDAWELASDLRERGRSYEAWAKRFPKLAEFLGPVETPLAAQIDRFLQQKGSPLAGLGQVFVSVAKKAGINPLLLVGIAGAESSFGTNLGSRSWGAYNNPFGWMTAAGPPNLMPFPSAQRAIEHVGTTLGERGWDLGNIQQWAPTYVGHSWDTWYRNVMSAVNALR